MPFLDPNWTARKATRIVCLYSRLECQGLETLYRRTFWILKPKSPQLAPDTRLELVSASACWLIFVASPPMATRLRSYRWTEVGASQVRVAMPFLDPNWTARKATRIVCLYSRLECQGLETLYRRTFWILKPKSHQLAPDTRLELVSASACWLIFVASPPMATRLRSYRWTEVGASQVRVAMPFVDPNWTARKATRIVCLCSRLECPRLESPYRRVSWRPKAASPQLAPDTPQMCSELWVEARSSVPKTLVPLGGPKLQTTRFS